MTAQPVPLHNLDRLAAEYLDLTEHIDQLTSRRDTVKAQLRDLGPGEHRATDGTLVTVSAPARRFNPTTAINLLPTETLQHCRADGYDTAKLKKYLSPVLLEQCMDAGTGEQVVRVK